jgi:hypothetical protein
MYTRTVLAVLAVVLPAAALTATPAALAEERTCRGALGATTVVDLVVSQGRPAP